MAARGRNEAAAARRQQAMLLRQSGASYRDIGAKLGVSEAQAHRDVHAELQRLNKQNLSSAEELRRLEDAKLDAMELALARQVRDGSHGAIDRLLRIMDRRAKLWGLDAPTRTDNRNYDMSGFSDEELAQIAEGVDPAQIVKGRTKQ